MVQLQASKERRTDHGEEDREEGEGQEEQGQEELRLSLQVGRACRLSAGLPSAPAGGGPAETALRGGRSYFKNSRIMSATASGWSSWGKWDAPEISMNRTLGLSRKRNLAEATGLTGSSEPQMTRDGCSR